MASPIKFAHVVLRTARFEEMLRWWTTVLQADVRFGNDFIAFLSYDEEHHRVAMVNMPGLADPEEGQAGVEHFAFTYETPDDLFDTYKRLKAEGIGTYWTIHHGATLSAYYRDPDGNQVELQIDTMSLPEADDFMRSPVFAANPIGIDVNLDELIGRYEAGDLSVLAYPADAGAA